MPITKINNNQIYYEIHGSGSRYSSSNFATPSASSNNKKGGPPLLLISGLGCDSQDWPETVPALADHFKVITFDNRATGRSYIPAKPFTILDMADDVIKLLDSLDIPAAHIIGHSMGGYIAQQIAIDYPEYVNKLIIESSAPISSVRNNLLFRNFFNWRKEGMNLESWLEAWLFWLFTPKCFENNEFISNYMKAALKYPYPQSTAGFNYQIEAISTFDVRTKLDKIKAETLIIEGKEDILILPSEAQTLTEGIARSSLLLIENAAHRVHTENIKAFNQSVLDFLLS